MAKTTRDLVAETATAMFLDGVRPSVNSVRERIGRGSNGTIQTALNEWWANLSAEVKAAKAMPRAVPEQVSDAFATFWKVACDAADLRYSKDRERFAQILLDNERLSAELAHSTLQIESLKKQIGALQIEAKKALAERSELEIAVAAEKSRSDTLKDEVVSMRGILSQSTRGSYTSRGGKS